MLRKLNCYRAGCELKKKRCTFFPTLTLFNRNNLILGELSSMGLIFCTKPNFLASIYHKRIILYSHSTCFIQLVKSVQATGGSSDLFWYGSGRELTACKRLTINFWNSYQSSINILRHENTRSVGETYVNTGKYYIHYAEV